MNDTVAAEDVNDDDDDGDDADGGVDRQMNALLATVSSEPGWTPDDLAKKFGVSVKTMRNRLAKAAPHIERRQRGIYLGHGG